MIKELMKLLSGEYLFEFIERKKAETLAPFTRKPEEKDKE